MIDKQEENKLLPLSLLKAYNISYYTPTNQRKLFSQEKFETKFIIQNYCMCDICFLSSSKHSYCNEQSFMSSFNTNEIVPYSCRISIDSSPMITLTSNQANKAKNLDTIDFETNIDSLLSTLKMVMNEKKVLVYGRNKIVRRHLASIRRSQYIGVFKNGDNWQALISIHKRKTYIGTYVNEIDAAKVFDFYSILKNRFTATTNFNYTKRKIIEMIENFVSNNGKYIPLYTLLSAHRKAKLNLILKLQEVFKISFLEYLHYFSCKTLTLNWIRSFWY